MPAPCARQHSPLEGGPPELACHWPSPRVNRIFPRPFCFLRLRSPPQPAPSPGSQLPSPALPTPAFPRGLRGLAREEAPRSGGWLGRALSVWPAGGRWRLASCPVGVCRPRCARVLSAVDAQPRLAGLALSFPPPGVVRSTGSFNSPLPRPAHRQGEGWRPFTLPGSGLRGRSDRDLPSPPDWVFVRPVRPPAPPRSLPGPHT